MCGIVGYCGPRPAGELLLTALERLEYRGYDSAGIALLTDAGLFLERRAGKLGVLQRALADQMPRATTGITHTRWATHGAPNDENAHPHRDCADQIAVVHNGIIENHDALRRELLDRGHRFRSETDSETIAHLLEEERSDLFTAMRAVLPRLEGAYAIVALHAAEPDVLVGARRQAPLVAGIGDGEGFLASDPLALAGFAREICYLEEGDLVRLQRDQIEIYDATGAACERPRVPLTLSPALLDRAGHAHYMKKEIFEQPAAIERLLAGRIHDGSINLPELAPLEAAIKGATRVEIVACGSAHYAGLLLADWIERWSGLPARSSVGSEFRYNPPALDRQTLVIAISQSGETADTLAATRLAQAAGAPLLAIVSADGSTLAREADAALLLRAGPEIAVAATKSFTAQLTAGLLCASQIASLRSREHDAAGLARALACLPAQLALALTQSESCVALAARLQGAAGFLYLGRGELLPIAYEGALKLKEVSAVHADGYPAGELKHGPIALVDPSRPIIALLGDGVTRTKMTSSLMECRARGGFIVAVSEPGHGDFDGVADAVLSIPSGDPRLRPILAAIPLQRFAYEDAVLRGADVDQPRNLAKSVTVE